MFSCKNCMIAMLFVLLAAAPIFAESTSGSTHFGVSTKMFAAGTEIPAGEYTVKWKSNSPDVTVTFSAYGEAPIVVKGKIVTGDKKYQWNSMAVEKDASGREIIRELQFGGKKMSIVFE